MSGILTPGYLRWDGTKYVLDHDVEIVGPAGSQGPAGPTGPAGPPGPSGTASGDLTGTYPGPIAVVGLTGILGVVSFGGSVPNPTITQTTTGATTGQIMTLRAQDAVTFGGNLVLQTGVGSTPGILQFLIGNTQAAYFDANRIFRIGPTATATVAGPHGTSPIAGTNYIYGNSAASGMISELFTGAASQRALSGVYNYASAGVGVNGVSIQAPGSGFSVASYQGQGVIEQTGTSTSGLVFGKKLGDGTSQGVTGRIWQSGAWGIGDSFNVQTSANAQAGVSGAVINIGNSGNTVTPTTTTNQTIIFNQSDGFNNYGQLVLQGNLGVTLMSATTTVARTTTTKFITSVGKRIRVRVPGSYPDTLTTSDDVVSIGTLVAPVTVNLPAGPTTGDTYIIKDANGSAAAFNITISGNGVNIDGGFASIVLMTNFTQAVFTYNGTTWISSLTNNVSPNAGYTSVVNVAGGGSTTVTGFDQLILCDTVGGTTTVTAPASPVVNMRFTVKDANGNASGNNISVVGNGRTLESPTSPGTYASPTILNTNNRSATWAFDPVRNRYTLVSTVP